MKIRPSAASKAIALAAPLSALYITPAHSAFDAFIKIDGVDGESATERHRDQIEIHSWSWGAANPSAVDGGGGGGRVVLSELTVVKEVDKSTPKLFLEIARGGPVGEVVLQMTDSRDGEEGPVFYEIVLKDVYVTSLDSGVRTEDEELTENITLNFSEMKLTYANRDDEGGFIDIEKDETAVTATVVNPDRLRE